MNFESSQCRTFEPLGSTWYITYLHSFSEIPVLSFQCLNYLIPKQMSTNKIFRTLRTFSFKVFVGKKQLKVLNFPPLDRPTVDLYPKRVGERLDFGKKPINCPREMSSISVFQRLQMFFLGSEKVGDKHRWIGEVHQHLYPENVEIKGDFAVKCCWGWWFMIRRASRKRTTSTGLHRKVKHNSNEPPKHHWSNIWVESDPWNSPIKWRT